jgi:hypothetical protein
MQRTALAVLGAALAFSACKQPDAAPAPIALFNGRDLTGWHADVPTADGKPDTPPSFTVKDGLLVSLGTPPGHLITDASYSDYRLVVEWRWPAAAGNCGVLVHTSKPRALGGMFPQSLECQLQSGNAGDFWCIGEDIVVPDMAKRRNGRHIVNLTDGSEKPPGEWNQMVVECRGRSVDVQVNGTVVNHGTDCTADRGQIALQAEGAVVEFRRLELSPLGAQ